MKLQAKNIPYIHVAYYYGLVLAIFQIERVLFYFFNYKSFSTEVDLQELLFAFLHGIRFDLSIIASVNILWLAWTFLPFPYIQKSWHSKSSQIVFLILNIPLVLFNLIDLEYFSFIGKRSGSELLGIIGDISDQASQLGFHYLHIPLIGIALAVGVTWTTSNIKFNTSATWWKHYLVFSCCILISIFASRGGFQYRPIKPDNAFIHTPNKLGHLVLNTPFNFITTLQQPKLDDVMYFTESELNANLARFNPPAKSPKAPNYKNVVLLIMESFSAEYSGLYQHQTSYTPFFDSLARASTFLPHHYANGRRSIDATPALLASIPCLMDEPYTTGVYQNNEIHGIGELLKNHGYYTLFFHGGKNGTMGFDSFTKNAGIEQYYGLDQYPNKEKDFDGVWGIYDEPYLQWASNMLTQSKKPFFATIFTLSSHQPYSIPSHLKGKFPKGNLEIHESLGYADYSLKKFFEHASKQNWYSNTLFIITADHTQEMEYEGHDNVINNYLVPLILFSPTEKIIVDTTKTTQHCDIPPTIAEYIGIENKPRTLFGSSIFSEGDGRALQFASGEYVLIHKDKFLLMNKNGKTRASILTDPHLKTNAQDTLDTKSMELELKTYIQYYNNGLNQNNWYNH